MYDPPKIGKDFTVYKKTVKKKYQNLIIVSDIQ